MKVLDEARLRAAVTYNAASDHFDHPANSFWDRFGHTTVDRLNLKPGNTVLDVCSGAGASAIPAAQRVGPDGAVIAVDLAENLLELAKAKAQRLGLYNVRFRSRRHAVARLRRCIVRRCRLCLRHFFSCPICRRR